MILAYAGRRPSGPDGDFPADREHYLTERVERLVAGLRPQRVVGSAAAGSDLIVLEAAARFGVPATVVISGDVVTFAADSVDDKPGWRQRLDAVLDAPLNTVTSVATAGGVAAYRAVTAAIVTAATEENARARTSDVRDSVLVGLLVSAGSRGDDDYTEDLGLRLKAAGHHVLRLDPALGRAASPVAFVAMPFGLRKDPTKRMRAYESDATWNRLLLPALLDAGYRPVRADNEASLQLIDARMVQDLLGADLVVADTATLNANVFWELGVRHAARRRGTLVVGPDWVGPPFDIRAVPVTQYTRDPAGVSDGDLVAGLTSLKGAIAAATHDQSTADAPDSPVHAAVTSLAEIRPPAQVDGGWAEKVTVAADLRDAHGLLRLRADAAAADLPAGTKAGLDAQLAAAMTRLGRHNDAAVILGPLAEADTEYHDERLQQAYGHALVRSEGDEQERAQHLALAEHRLRLLDTRRPGSGETLGLLGSAAKERANRRQAAGQDPTEELRLAADAYRRGFAADPTDYYPGVNAVLTLRLLARLTDDDESAAEARRLLPVVRFAVTRVPTPVEDVWAHATLGELALQSALLHEEDDDDDLRLALRHYRQAAAHATPQGLTSMARQLRLMIAFGDPPSAVVAVLAAVEERQATTTPP